MSFRTRFIPLLIAVALTATGAACSDDDLTPEEARRQRVEDRLEASFGQEAAACMLDGFSDELLVALDGEGEFPEAGPEIEEFTTVARECIGETDGTPPTTPSGDGTEPEAPTEEEGDDQPSDAEAPATSDDVNQADPDTGTDEVPPADGNGTQVGDPAATDHVG